MQPRKNLWVQLGFQPETLLGTSHNYQRLAFLVGSAEQADFHQRNKKKKDAKVTLCNKSRFMREWESCDSETWHVENKMVSSVLFWLKYKRSKVYKVWLILTKSNMITEQCSQRWIKEGEKFSC